MDKTKAENKEETKLQAEQAALSFKQAASRYGVAESTMYDWARKNLFPVFRVGGTSRILVKDLETFEQTHRGRYVPAVQKGGVLKGQRA